MNAVCRLPSASVTRTCHTPFERPFVARLKCHWPLAASSRRKLLPVVAPSVGVASIGTAVSVVLDIFCTWIVCTPVETGTPLQPSAIFTGTVLASLNARSGLVAVPPVASAPPIGAANPVNAVGTHAPARPMPALPSANVAANATWSPSKPPGPNAIVRTVLPLTTSPSATTFDSVPPRSVYSPERVPPVPSLEKPWKTTTPGSTTTVPKATNVPMPPGTAVAVSATGTHGLGGVSGAAGVTLQTADSVGPSPKTGAALPTNA